jgi:hypothetical protein
MKYIYLVDYWVPFPSSEYGGMISIIAENDEECHQILAEFPEFDDKYISKIMENVVKAPRFALAEKEESRVLDVFIT